MSIFDPFVDVIEGAADIASSVIDRVPGLSHLKKFLVENPVIGSIVFTAMGSALFAGIANTSIPAVSGMQTVGPQIASVAFAVPGMVFKGQGFIKAYTEDLTARVSALVAYFARKGGGEVSDKLPAASEEAKKQFSEPLEKMLKDSGLEAEVKKALYDFSQQQLNGKDITKLSPNEVKAALDKAGLDPVKLAARKGVRPDVAATSLNAWTGISAYSAGDPSYAEFDVIGNPKQSLAPAGAPLPNVDLAQLQENLRTLGYKVYGALGVGTENDPTIIAAVKDFQSKNDLPPTGQADARTRALLATAVKLPRVAAEIRTAPKPTLSPEVRNALAGIRTPSASGGATQGFLPQLATFAVLTSPAWFTFLVLPRLRTLRARRPSTRTAKRR